MSWLPLILSFVAGLVLAPAALDAMDSAGLVRQNWRGRALPASLGLAIVAAGLVALAPIALLDELADENWLPPASRDVLLYGIGVAFLGFADDVLGGRAKAGAPSEPAAPRGWRGHGTAAAGGSLTTGALKAVGALALALLVLSGKGYDTGEYLLAVALLVLATNAFNLLDLRPGRALKVLGLLGVALTLATWDTEPARVLGILLGGALAMAPYDLGERGMLGDAGSNLLGALAGFWLIYSLGTTGQAVALVVLLVITIYGEFRSISALIERNPLTRGLDSIGRRA
jgi:UDP-N-acetylmuramyl pentapeptide phosphotransferase/UDP-N-acetylglucosamine-1-phosphate transferase